jgi:hypothetical protein
LHRLLVAGLPAHCERFCTLSTLKVGRGQRDLVLHAAHWNALARSAGALGVVQSPVPTRHLEADFPHAGRKVARQPVSDDGTIVKAHRAASGAKGGAKSGDRLAAAGAQRKSTPLLTVMAAR